MFEMNFATDVFFGFSLDDLSFLFDPVQNDLLQQTLRILYKQFFLNELVQPSSRFVTFCRRTYMSKIIQSIQKPPYNKRTTVFGKHSLLRTFILNYNFLFDHLADNGSILFLIIFLFFF